jgi:hypothetical protein
MSEITNKKKPGLLMPALRHYAFWAVDMATAIVGFVYGFGLEVKSWSALIGILLVSRWAVFVGFGAHDLGARRKQWEAERKGGDA